MRNLRKKSKRGLRQFIDEQLRFLELKLTRKKQSKYAKAQQAKIDDSIEQLVEATNSHIKIIANYKKKLRKSVADLERYVETLIDMVEAQPLLKLADFDQDDRLQALFFERKLADKFFDDFAPMFEVSKSLYMMSTSPDIKEVFMPALQHGEMIKDVRKRVLNFKSKHIEQAFDDNTEMREGLRQYFLEQIVVQIKKVLEPHMVSGYAELKQQTKIETLSPKAYLNAIIKLLQSPNALFKATLEQIKTDDFGVVDSSVDTTSGDERIIDYIFFTPEHGAPFSLFITQRT